MIYTTIYLYFFPFYCAGSNAVIDILFCRMFARLNNTRIADYNGMAGNITVYIAVGGNQNVISDGDISHNRAVNANPNVIANGGHTFSFAPVFLPDGYAFVDVDIASQHGFGIDRNAIGVANV